MRVLLTGIPKVLYGDLVQILARHHVIMTLDGDVRDRDVCAAAADCDVIIQGLPESSEPLTALDHASRGTWNLLTTTRAHRYVLLSSMRIFESYGTAWQVTETWTPRPTADPDDLAPYLAEVASREISRARPIECLVLRLDEVISAERFGSGSVQSRWLHVDDAIASIYRAVTVERVSTDDARWVPLHIVRGGPGSRFPAGKAAYEPFEFSAKHQTNDQTAAVTSAPVFPDSPSPLTGLPFPKRIVMFGAGGPLGAVSTKFLKDRHQLRLTDLRPLREISHLHHPQSAGAPLPEPATPPHEERVVDVTDPSAVLAAVQSMEAIMNCTVVRHDLNEAFRVNTLGAFNVMRAAAALGIRRVVQTGPVLTLAPHPVGYTEDCDVGFDVPSRPGDNLYFISKFLGQEICRIFSEQYRIACPNLLFSGFVNPTVAEKRGVVSGPFTTSWNDSGRAMVAAVQVPQLPTPYLVFYILADAPHGRYRNDSARRVLRWQPQDRLDNLWRRHI